MFNWQVNEREATIRPRGVRLSGRLIIGLVFAVISLITYFNTSSYNQVTGQKQYIDISVEQEIALGLQAKPEMTAQFGGYSRDSNARSRVEQINNVIVGRTAAGRTGYPIEAHLLADAGTVNAFALPGGQVFLTEGLYRLLKTEGQLAAVLAHEVGHVVGRHSAAQLAKQRLTQGLTGAAILATYDPADPSSRRTAGMIELVGSLITLKYGRTDELQADALGVRFLAESGYDPRAIIGVMEILRNAARGNQQPEFFSTHPDPEHRIEAIDQQIQEQFPNGVPQGLKQ